MDQPCRAIALHHTRVPLTIAAGPPPSPACHGLPVPPLFPVVDNAGRHTTGLPPLSTVHHSPPAMDAAHHLWHCTTHRSSLVARTGDDTAGTHARCRLPPFSVPSSSPCRAKCAEPSPRPPLPSPKLVTGPPWLPPLTSMTGTELATTASFLLHSQAHCAGLLLDHQRHRHCCLSRSFAMPCPCRRCTSSLARRNPYLAGAPPLSSWIGRHHLAIHHAVPSPSPVI